MKMVGQIIRAGIINVTTRNIFFLAHEIDLFFM